MTKNQIDYLDYAILKCLDELGGGMWKKKIHESIIENRDSFPGIDTVSVQTIGRHVDDLRDEDKLAACIVSPRSIDREYIIGFKLTDEGRDYLTQKRKDILRTEVVQSGRTLIDPIDEINIEKRALIALIGDEFGLDADTREHLSETLTRDDLIALTALYYVTENLSNLVTPDTIENLVTTLHTVPELQEHVFTESMIATVQNGIAAATGNDAGFSLDQLATEPATTA